MKDVEKALDDFEQFLAQERKRYEGNGPWFEGIRGIYSTIYLEFQSVRKAVEQNQSK